MNSGWEISPLSPHKLQLMCVVLKLITVHFEGTVYTRPLSFLTLLKVWGGGAPKSTLSSENSLEKLTELPDSSYPCGWG